jgi:hypothetical protein
MRVVKEGISFEKETLPSYELENRGSKFEGPRSRSAVPSSDQLALPSLLGVISASLALPQLL